MLCFMFVLGVLINQNELFYNTFQLLHPNPSFATYS